MFVHRIPGEATDEAAPPRDRTGRGAGALGRLHGLRLIPSLRRLTVWRRLAGLEGDAAIRAFGRSRRRPARTG